VGDRDGRVPVPALVHLQVDRLDDLARLQRVEARAGPASVLAFVELGGGVVSDAIRSRAELPVF
jgi:hypothetical protein